MNLWVCKEDGSVYRRLKPPGSLRRFPHYALWQRMKLRWLMFWIPCDEPFWLEADPFVQIKR